MILSQPRGRFVRLAGIGALLLAVLVSIVGPTPQLARAATTLTQWTFTGSTTAPSTGSGTATLLGTTATFATGNPGPLPDVSWNTTSYPAQSTGSRTEGVQFQVSTLGYENIGFSFDLRHSNTAANTVALQYSTDGVNFADATTFTTTSGDTYFPRSFSFDAIPAIDNTATIYFRVVSSFPAGGTAYVPATATSTYSGGGTMRYDNVTVTGDPAGPPPPPPAPSVTLSVSTDVASEAAQTVVTISANASAAVTGDQTVALAVSGVDASDYTLSGTTITIPGGATTGSVSFTVVDDAAVEGSETATLTISSPSAGITLGATTSRTVTIADNDAPIVPVCEQPFTPIYAIQGSGSSAAITGNVTTQGVVVGDFETGAALQGFYLQDASGDGNSATSDGIFVFTGSSANLVSVGQLVRVTGFARERFNMTALNGANDNNAVVPAASIASCGSGSVAPVDVSMPFPSTTYLEQFEGMAVRFPQALQISEYFNFDRFGELALALPLAGEPRPFTGTAVDAPGAAANARTLANSLSRITLDDGRGSQNPDPARHPNGADFTLSNRFRGGDQVQNAVGVLSFDFSLYRIQPTGPADFSANNPRPAAPTSVGGRLKVGAFNTLNYFLTLDTTANDNGPGPCGGNANLDCRGADSDQPDEFTRQRAKLLAAIQGINADVLGLIELENTPNVEPLQNIVAGLNAIPGVGPYAFIETGTIGTDAIKVGLIYKPGKVTPVGGFQVLDSTDDPNFLDTKNRPVLAQSFRENATGATFTVAVAHLKSKGSACTDVGDPDTSDGQGNCNQTRAKAANALVKWLDTNPAFAGDKDFLIVGDLNAYAKEDPISEILAGPDDSLGTSDDYTNLILQYLGPFAYSYVFDGQFGYLDHALASASLTPQVTGATEWHINADEPDLLDYDTTFKQPAQDALFESNAFRTSDHDPVLVGLGLTTPNTPPALVASATYDTGLGLNGAEIVSVRGNFALLSNAGDSSVDVLDISDILAPTLLRRVSVPPGLNSVAIHPTLDLFLTVSGTAGNIGTLAAYRLSDGALLGSGSTGIQPDSVAITPDGSKAVVANEAEGVAQNNRGGDGSLSVLSLSGFDTATTGQSLNAAQLPLPSFAGTPGFSTGRTDDIARLPIDNTPATLEPESIAFSPDSAFAFVSLQENNGIVRLDLSNNGISAFGLGTTTRVVDTTNNDGFNPATLLTLFREPDGVAFLEIGGTRYLFTADEGDSRDGGPAVRVRGGRTVSVFNADTGAFVGDTGNQLDELAARFGLVADADTLAVGYPDGRSDRGGVEPEVLDAISFAGRAFAAVGLERSDAVALVELTNPAAPTVLGLIPVGNAPEGVKLVERDGQLFVFAANERSGTLTIATLPVAPLVVSQRYNEDTPLALLDLLGIDPNPDSFSVELALSPASAGSLNTTSASGSLAQVNAALAGLVFTPAANFNGPATLVATFSDGVNPAVTGTINLVGAAVNDAPVAVDDSFTTAEDTAVTVNVLTNDSDLDGDTLTVSAVTQGASGSVAIVAGGVQYTPNANFNGADSFTYTLSDGNGGTATATVNVTVTPVNDGPSIAQLAGTGACVAGNVASGSFRVAVSDIEPAAGDLSVTTSSTNPLIGASVGGSGDSREVIFTVASSNQVQTGTVTLTVTDAGGATATLTVRVGAGTNQANVIVGNGSQINVIFGLGGNDVLRGGNLGDLICGGNGNDLIIAGDGDDNADGGSGDDVVNGQGGADSLIGGNGGDVLSGGEGNDSLDGGSGGDVLFGESGDDTLTGGSGADLFSGGPGSDRATDYNRREGDVRLSIEL